ncbi:MAG: hypothetical protein ABL967_09625 [Bryobacteraceae bacterium]
MAKQCPKCRAIVGTTAAHCSCGFQFFTQKATAGSELSRYCMRVGGGVFVIAGLAVVALRFL